MWNNMVQSLPILTTHDLAIQFLYRQIHFRGDCTLTSIIFLIILGYYIKLPIIFCPLESSGTLAKKPRRIMQFPATNFQKKNYYFVWFLVSFSSVRVRLASRRHNADKTHLQRSSNSSKVISDLELALLDSFGSDSFLGESPFK